MHSNVFRMFDFCFSSSSSSSSSPSPSSHSVYLFVVLLFFSIHKSSLLLSPFLFCSSCCPLARSLLFLPPFNLLLLSLSNRFSGNVTRLAVIPSCGSIECSLQRGLSAFSPTLGLYFSASFLALLTLDSTTGQTLSHASWQPDVSNFDGFFSLEFAGNSSLKSSGDDGLLGLSTLGGTEVVLFSLNSYSGRATKVLKVMEAEKEADLAGGPSCLSDNKLYLLLYSTRLVLIDLTSGAVSFLAPFDLQDLGIPQPQTSWHWLEIVPFQVARKVDMFDDVQFSVWDDNITVLGLPESLPISPGSFVRGVYFSLTLLGSGVRVNDSMQITRVGDCQSVLPGGGPFLIRTPELHTQDFALDFTDEQQAQLCILSGSLLDRTLRVVPWAPEGGLSFPLSQAMIELPVAPLPLGAPVLATMRGLLSTGDQLKMVVDDGTAQPVDQCKYSQLVPGTEVLEVQTGGFSLTQRYSRGSTSISTFQLLLTDNSTSTMTFCYRRRGESVAPPRFLLFFLLLSSSSASSSSVPVVLLISSFPSVVQCPRFPTPSPPATPLSAPVTTAQPPCLPFFPLSPSLADSPACTGLLAFLPVPYRLAEQQPSPLLKFSLPLSTLSACSSSSSCPTPVTVTV